jgi:phage baseplate assembly protein W
MRTLYRGFSTVAANRKFKLTDLDLVKQDLINHFHIKKGEKLMNPDFGTVIWSLLFENLTDDVKSVLTDDIKRIASYDPRLQINNINITEFDHGIQIELWLQYSEYDQSQVMYLNFDRDSQKLTVA